MFISMRSIRGAAVGAMGAGALAGAMLFGAIPDADAAPAPAPASFAIAGPNVVSDIPQAPAVSPTRWGHGGGGGFGHGGFGRGGFGHGGFGHGGFGRGGFGRGGGFFNHGRGFRPWF
jgi:hypothetical protein